MTQLMGSVCCCEHEGSSSSSELWRRVVLRGECGGGSVLRNFGILQQNYPTSKPWRERLESSPSWNPQISFEGIHCITEFATYYTWLQPRTLPQAKQVQRNLTCCTTGGQWHKHVSVLPTATQFFVTREYLA